MDCIYENKPYVRIRVGAEEVLLDLGTFKTMPAVFNAIMAGFPDSEEDR